MIVVNKMTPEDQHQQMERNSDEKPKQILAIYTDW